MCLGRPRRPRSAASTRGLSTYVYVRGIGEGEYEREQLFPVIFAFELNCVRESCCCVCGKKDSLCLP